MVTQLFEVQILNADNIPMAFSQQRGIGNINCLLLLTNGD
jgi:hypothetical protein